MRRALVLVLLTIPVVLDAQSRMTPGSRVRVQTAGDRTIEGTLVAKSEDTLTVGVRDAVRTAIPMESISRISMNEGKSRGRGAIQGMKIGAAVLGGGVAVIVTGAYLGYSGEADNALGGILTYTALGAVEGALLGALIGSAVGAEKWTTVYSRPVRITFLPRPNGPLQIGLSVQLQRLVQD